MALKNGFRIFVVDIVAQAFECGVSEKEDLQRLAIKGFRAPANWLMSYSSS